jgi:hypothetical protein
MSCLKALLTSKLKSNRKGSLKEKRLIEMPWDPVADFTTSVELFWSGRSQFDQPDQALDL